MQLLMIKWCLQLENLDIKYLFADTWHLSIMETIFCLAAKVNFIEQRFPYIYFFVLKHLCLLTVGFFVSSCG